MPEFLTKHEPVDDYPYICYAPDENANTSNISSGGGGGGGGGAALILDTNNATFDEEEVTYTFTETYNDIKNALDNGNDVILIWRDLSEQYGDIYNYGNCVALKIAESIIDNVSSYMCEVAFLANNTYYGSTDSYSTIESALGEPLVLVQQ